MLSALRSVQQMLLMRESADDNASLCHLLLNYTIDPNLLIV